MAWEIKSSANLQLFINCSSALHQISSAIHQLFISYSSVIHSAGLKSIKESLSSPLEYWDVNVLGTINLVKLMNEYRSAQCNAPKGNYAEAFFFEPSFPFSDVRNILPKSPEILPFHIENINGFL